MRSELRTQCFARRTCGLLAVYFQDHCGPSGSVSLWPSYAGAQRSLNDVNPPSSRYTQQERLIHHHLPADTLGRSPVGIVMSGHGQSQLPLSAFFGPSSSRRSAKTKVSPKRKESPIRGRAQEPPSKKRKQKENITPTSSRADVRFGEVRQHGDTTTGGLRTSLDDGGHTSTSKDAGHDVERELVHSLEGDGEDNCNPSRQARSLETPPSTPTRTSRHGLQESASLPSPPLTAPGVKRTKLTHSEGKNVTVYGHERLPRLDCVVDASEPPQRTGFHSRADDKTGELRCATTSQIML